MRTLLIANIDYLATLDSRSTTVRNGYIYVEDDRIVEIGQGDFAGQADRTIDGTDRIAIPGLVNTHHHMYQCLTRNTPRAQLAGLFDWLVCHYDVWGELDEEATYLSAKVAIGELLLSGCTTTTDHFYLFPASASPKLLDAEIRAARELGMRFQPCRGSMSRGKSDGGLPPDNTVQTPETILADCERVISSYHDSAPRAMLRIALAPCSPFSVTEALMTRTVELAREAGVSVHTHLAETHDETAYCLESYGCRPLALMERLGWLGPDVWLAHGIHFDESELALLAETGTGISHCPTSNMRLGSGVARLPEMLAAGVSVGLGVDGSASNDCGNLLAECRQTLLVHRGGPSDQWLDSEQVFRLATSGGARVLGRDDIGMLAVGLAADVVLIDRMQLSLAGTSSDPLAGLLYSTPAAPVDTVIVGGQVVVENGRLPGLDVPELVRAVNALSEQMIARASDKTGINYMERP